jgi:hypothetical protein
MKILITCCIALVTLLSCSKDRRVIKKLDGTWNVDSMHVKYVYYRNTIFNGQLFPVLDTTRAYTFTNCGEFNFDKATTATSDYRLGNVQITIPALSDIAVDTLRKFKAFNDKESFYFFVDQIYNRKNISNMGIVGDTSKLYRNSKFTDAELKTKKIMLTYSIDSLKYGFLGKRKCMFETFISKK